MDRVLAEKAQTVERCLARVREKYIGHEHEFLDDIDRQDIIVINLQRACQAIIDMAMWLGRRHRLEIPENSADIFRILNAAGLLDADLAAAMVAMVGFRNIATHEYRKLDLKRVRNIIEYRLNDLTAASQALVRSTQAGGRQ